ncbi:MAG: SIMPL domain-containing protein [Candidatus Eremiobacteraeota bacterium]|nr:SIMPL domain-containing protein [Candidatus Eremiobacteraeota bacterium]
MKRILLTLGIVALCGAPALAANPTAIAVTGNAVVTVVPDIATINASITTTDPHADTATSRNNALYEKAVAAITARGIARSDITLSYYNINYQPKPHAEPGQPVMQGNYGYTVTRSFAVKVRAIAKAGPAVDAIAPVAGIEVGGVNFDIADPAPARAQATDKAVADARTKAESLARAAGLHIVGIRRIELNGGGNAMPQPMIRTSMAAAKMPTNFDTGSVNVSVDVNMVYLAAP